MLSLLPSTHSLDIRDHGSRSPRDRTANYGLITQLLSSFIATMGSIDDSLLVYGNAFS
jgi:hypothetical protein